MGAPLGLHLWKRPGAPRARRSASADGQAITGSGAGRYVPRVLAGTCALGLAVIPPGALAGATPAPAAVGTTGSGAAAVTVQGQLPSTLAGAKLAVIVEPPFDSATAPTTIQMSEVSSTTATSNSFSLPVSAAAIEPYEGPGGNVNLELVAATPHYQALSSLAVSLPTGSTSSTGSTSALAGRNVHARVMGAAKGASTSGSTVDLGRLTAQQTPTTAMASAATGPNVDRLCTSGSRIQQSPEIASRIGEIHVADVALAAETYVYHNAFTSTFTAGYSTTAGGTYSAGGSTSISHGESSTASTRWTAGYVRYVNSHFEYGKYLINQPGGCINPHYTDQVDVAIGDVFLGPNSPAQLGGECTSQPYYAELDGYPGQFNQDHSTAQQYTATSAFGFTFADTTGFSSDIHDDYTVGTTTQKGVDYVCGKGNVEPIHAKILYNTAG